MKQSELLSNIRNNLKDYPIDYLRGKSSDKYPDSITKRLAIYNTKIYDEIFSLDLNNIEFESEIKIETMNNISNDLDYYFTVYDVYDEDEVEFTKNLCLYLSLIAKKPLHPVGTNPKKDDVFKHNSEYFCKNKIKYVKDKNSLCMYCICKNAPFNFY